MCYGLRWFAMPIASDWWWPHDLLQWLNVIHIHGQIWNEFEMNRDECERVPNEKEIELWVVAVVSFQSNSI